MADTSLSTPSTPQSTTWLTPSTPQLWLTLSTPQLLPTLSTLPQLTTPLPQLTRLRPTPMRFPPTLTPTLLLMTTPSPTQFFGLRPPTQNIADEEKSFIK